MKEPHDHFIHVRGLKIHYLEWGERNGEPLILVHGWRDHARSWDFFVAALRERYGNQPWIIAPDCRGHGDSGWVGAGGYYHFPDYVMDLDCLIEHLQVSHLSLIGHSMGGTISFLYSGTFPSRVKKLVLIEGIGPLGMAFSDAPARMEKFLSEMQAIRQGNIEYQSFEYPSFEEAARRLQKINPRLGREKALLVARWGMRQTPSGKWVWKFDPLHRATSPQPFYSAQAMEFFRRIQCPVLIVQGKESRQTPRPDTEERLSAITHQTVAVVSDAGHMVHQDNPRALAEVVVPFLEGL
ncbi:MAG: alpha/beta hydrolase [Deltaproteobacteria bacterium]|nr:alpha/beta hydrolase [Deltaproteobacteria bacterium]